MTDTELRDLLGRCTPEKILALTGPIWSINRIDEDDGAIFWEVSNYDGFLIQFHERDDKRAKNYAEMVYALPALAAELIEARAERDALREALRKYGRHKPSCNQSQYPAWGECNCGFEQVAAIRALKENRDE